MILDGDACQYEQTSELQWGYDQQVRKRGFTDVGHHGIERVDGHDVLQEEQGGEASEGVGRLLRSVTRG